MRAATSGILIISLKWPFSVLTISGGTPLGAMKPCHAPTSASRKPCSASVSTSGASGERLASATARLRSLPAAMCGATGPSVVHIIGMWPPTRSVIAGPLPR